MGCLVSNIPIEFSATGVELVRAVTFCIEIEQVKRKLVVGLGH